MHYEQNFWRETHDALDNLTADCAAWREVSAPARLTYSPKATYPVKVWVSFKCQNGDPDAFAEARGVGHNVMQAVNAARQSFARLKKVETDNA